MKAKEVEETKSPSGYGKPPWIFKGSALYQFHLVKAEIARAIIPKEFRLVEAFGYTLGGFFLANYEDSPVGTLDELVVIAGIVWNPPTSHAWAARVYVSSDEACNHGRKAFGLPSQVATFSKRIKGKARKPKRKSNDDFLTSIGFGGMDIQVAESNGSAAIGLCNIGMITSPVSKKSGPKWMEMGPVIKMSLPSFSGRTEFNPHLLKYACQIECRVKPRSAARVLGLEGDEKHSSNTNGESSEKWERNLSLSVMLSKPILALEFNCLKMQVEPPSIVSKGSSSFH